MTSSLVLGLLFSCCCVIVKGQATQTASPAAAKRVTTIKFESKLVKAVLPYNVIIPVDYDKPEAKNTRYPVLYLLHGLMGHYSDWATRTALADYASAYKLIVVMPEGNNGWYTDSATVPTDKYESYILEEVIPDVQHRYRTIEMREGRAIAGLSMGGYGALKFAVKHPDMFVFAASLSGAFGAATWTKEQRGVNEVAWQSLERTFGPTGSEVRTTNDIEKLYLVVTPERASSFPYIYLDCGTEDPFVPVNRSLEQILFDKKIPHEFRLLPGGHGWPYWNQQIIEVLRVARTVMKL